MDERVNDLLGRLNPDGLRSVADDQRSGKLAWLEAALGGDLFSDFGARARRGDYAGARALLEQEGLLAASTVVVRDEERERRRIGAWTGLVPLVALLAFAAVLLSRCGDDTGPATTDLATGGSTTLVDTAAAEPQLSTFVSLLGSSGLLDRLKGNGPFTVFAPDNGALSTPGSAVDALRANPELLRQVLAHHVVAGRFRSTDLQTSTLAALDGTNLDIAVAGRTIQVGGATVTRSDLRASNGVVHIVDRLVLPPGVSLPTSSLPTSPAATATTASARAQAAGTVMDVAATDSRLSQLRSLLDRAGLASVLRGPGPFTLFAPTNDALAKVPSATLDLLTSNPENLKKLLSFHTVDGSKKLADLHAGNLATREGGQLAVAQAAASGAITINGSKIVTADVAATNGVVHVIDGVLIPADLPATATTTTAKSAPASTTVVDVLAANGQFKTLSELLTKAGLATTLQGGGPFTIFGPSDAAFAKLPKATLDAISASPDALKKVLTYHVLAGALRSTTIQPGPATTLNGETVTLLFDGSTLRINSAAVTQADIPAPNGVVHAVDNVLIPANLVLGSQPAQKFSVFFDVDVDTPNPASQPVLDQALAAARAAKPSTTVILTGFADTRGDPASNFELSKRRAENVAASLQAAAPTLAFVTNAKGDTEGGTDLDQSRRVDIVIN